MESDTGCLASPVSLFRKFALALLGKPAGPIFLLQLLEGGTVLVSQGALGGLEVGVREPVIPAVCVHPDVRKPPRHSMHSCNDATCGSHRTGLICQQSGLWAWQKHHEL